MTGPRMLPILTVRSGDGRVLRREEQRMRARAQPRARTIHSRSLTRAALARTAEAYPEGMARPTTRGDCFFVPRPCPFVTCKFNLYLDVTRAGSIRLNFPHLEPSQLRMSCVLDVAALEGAPLEDVAELMNISSQRVEQLQKQALAKVERARARLTEGQ